MNNPISKPPISKSMGRTFFRYALLALPLAFLGLPLYLNLPKFYLEQYQVDLSTLGIALLCLRLGDAFLDPLIGRWSDRHVAQRPAIFIGSAIMCVISFNMLFLPPMFAPLLWFIVFTALTYFSYSVLTINYYSAGLQQADSYDGRTTLSAWREGVALIGILLAAILPQALQAHVPALQSFQIYGAVFSVLMVLGIATLLPRITKTVPQSGSQESLWMVLKNNLNLRWLLALFFFNALPSAITSTLFLFYTDDVLQAKDNAGYFLAVYFFAAVLSTPFWSTIAKKFGKRHALAAAMVLAMGSFVWAFLLGNGDADKFYIICIISGFALGADMILLPSLLADVMDGQDEHGSTGFGLWHALSKWSLALAAGITMPLLAAFGYQASAIQTASTQGIIAIAYALIPCGFKAIALGILLVSPLDQHHKRKPA